MALSNWASMSVTNEGTGNGSLTSYGGITAEIYKNWIYIRAPELWKPHGRFTEPVIAQIDQAYMTIHDLKILANRENLQNAVFVYAESSYYKEKAAKWMVGIGCSGFDGDRWVGVTPDLIEKFEVWLKDVLPERSYLNGVSLGDLDKIKGQFKYFNQGDAFFADHGLLVDTPVLEPGQVEEPVMSKIIKSM